MVSLEELPKGEDAVLVHAFGPVSVVVINRPSDNNSINDDVRDGLQRAFAEIAKDTNVRAAVLTSEGEEAFSVGADIAQLATLTPMEAKSLAEKTRAVYDAITSDSATGHRGHQRRVHWGWLRTRHALRHTVCAK